MSELSLQVSQLQHMVMGCSKDIMRNIDRVSKDVIKQQDKDIRLTDKDPNAILLVPCNTNNGINNMNNTLN